MALAGFEVITLACYGTLIDKASGVFSGLGPLLSRASANINRGDALNAFSAHESSLESEKPGMPYSDLLSEVHRRLAKQWYVIATEDDHQLFGMSVPHWPVYADTPAALQYLKRYFKLVILSNVDRKSFAGTNSHLGVKFDAIFTAQEIGSYKPNSRNFDYMLDKLQKLGVKKRQVLHVAHDPHKDLRPAAAKGLATAGIDRRREIAPQDATLESAKAAGWDFSFPSLANLVMAHQESLRA